MPSLDATEKFTWECLWANSCDECVVADYVRENSLDEEQQKRLINIATAAGAYLDRPAIKSRGATIDLIAEAYEGVVDVDAVTVVVDGWLQWQANGCRVDIRKEGEN